MIVVAAIICCCNSLTKAAVTTTGDVFPDPPVNGDPLQIGATGIGTFQMDGGSTFSSAHVLVGSGPGSVGKATVTGNGTHWLIQEGINVGDGGLGRLEIRNGAIVEITSGVNIGTYSGGHGTVVVEGEGTLMHSTGSLRIGENSDIGVLAIGAGAFVNVPENDTTIREQGKLELHGGYLRTSRLENYGLITGSGEIALQSFGSANNSGLIRVHAGEHLVMRIANGQTLTNVGEMDVRGGELELISGLYNGDQFNHHRKITLQDGILRTGLVGNFQGQPQLDNYSLIAAVNGENHVHGSVMNRQDGTITVTNNSLLMFHDNVKTEHNSTISVFAGSKAIFLGDLDMNGGTLLADLGGAEGYGHVEVVGEANLNGSLAVGLAGGYTPVVGDTFEILKASGGIGGFLQVAPQAELPVGMGWELEVEPNRLLLNVIEHLAGDYNGDRTVDAGDYTLWRNTLWSYNLLDADGDGDRQVDYDDYLIWKSNFGVTLGGGSQSLEAVPEPGTTLLLVIGLACLTIRRFKPSSVLGRC